ncbi:hypothetical protein AKJ16_DCAP10110 [Drosera capensis]
MVQAIKENPQIIPQDDALFVQEPADPYAEFSRAIPGHCAVHCWLAHSQLVELNPLKLAVLMKKSGDPAHVLGCVQLIVLVVLIVFVVGSVSLHFWADASVAEKEGRAEGSKWFFLPKNEGWARKVLRGGVAHRELNSREAKPTALIKRRLRTSSIAVQSPLINVQRSQGHGSLPPVP